MKKYLFLILMLSGLTAYCQKADEATAINFATTLLTPGSHKLEILEKNIPADLRQIITTYRKAVQDSLQWYNTYSQQHKNETPLPYHNNFGITEVEYNRMNKEFPLLKMKVKTTKEFVVNNTNDQIALKGDDDFTLLDAITIDTKNKTLVIGGEQIPYTGEVNENEESGVGTWKGYNWKLEVGSMDDVKAFKPVDYTMIDLTLGKTTDNKAVL
ncbi:MAG: hypothetical protein JSS96_08540, partial [Bacteroidetes bacterium]|nr:hypothetical protein [Bacteroidota bacterium]